MSSVIVDQRAEATKYIRDKKINKLFDILGAQLARQKPEDPNEFLLNELKRIAELKEKNQPVNQPLFSLAIFIPSLWYVSYLIGVTFCRT